VWLDSSDRGQSPEEQVRDYGKNQSYKMMILKCVS
jgi:hypothetical protein